MSHDDPGIGSDVQWMVERALGELTEPYGPDVMEDVWVQIEKHAGLQANYRFFCALKGQARVNKTVGDLTLTLTGYTEGESVPTTRTTLAESYTVLVPPESGEQPVCGSILPLIV